MGDPVTVNISLSGANPASANFGIGLLVAYHTQYADLVRSYANLPAVAVDFSTTSAVYAMAETFFSVNPSATPLKIGRRQTAFTETYTLGLATTAGSSGSVVSMTVDGKAVSITSSGVAATDAQALATAIVSATTGTVSATYSSANCLVTASTAGHVIRFQNWNLNQVAMLNTTPDPGLAADLNAILAANGNFYAFAIDSRSGTQTLAAAAWAESADKKEQFAESLDSIEATSTTTSGTSTNALTMKGLAYKKTVPVWNGNDTWSFSGVAAMGYVCTQTPGSYTLDLKTLVGVSPDDGLTSTQVANLLNKNLNVYQTVKGLELLQSGTNCNGGFEDTERFIDWLQDTLQTSVLAALASAKKIPYTNKGIRALGAVVNGVLQQGIVVGGLSDDPDEAPVITLPIPVSGIAASYITTRTLPAITFKAWLAGAIQNVLITGTVVGA